MKKYAVVTGDIVNSTLVEESAERKTLETAIVDVLKQYTKWSPFEKDSPNYLVYRGDSFQSIITSPKRALELALLIRLGIKKLGLAGDDARIAIGIGRVEQLTERINDSDGEAFRYSGRTLESMNNRLQIRLGERKLENGLNTSFLLLDRLVQGWSIEMAEAVFYYIQGETQHEIAKRLSISQPGVNKRLKTSGVDAVLHLLDYFETAI